jgi:hypothetical protein
LAIDDVYLLQLHQLYAGQQCMNTLAFRTKTATDPTQAVLQALADDWMNTIKPRQVTSLTYDHWVAQQVRGGTVSYPTGLCKREGGRRLEAGFTAPNVGLEAGDGLPPQSAWVTTLVTPFAGRSKRGRHYMTGIPENVQAQGAIAPASVTAYQTIWTSLITEYGVGGTSPTWEVGVWSFTIASGCTAATAPPWGLVHTRSGDPVAAFTGLTSATVRNVVYSQRKRTIGRGR